MTADPSVTACPKCGRRVAGPQAESCPRCGLTFSLWSAEQASGVARLDERGEALWAAAVASWSTPERHDELLRHCSVTGLLAAAGRRYRERLDQDAGDAVAARMQERVLAMATASFVRPAAAVPVTRHNWFWVLMAVCGLVGLGGALFLRR
jgi:hypothetical protein